MRKYSTSYPAMWRVMDLLEVVFTRIWPKGGGKLAPYLMLAPAIILVGVLAVGLLYIGDSSLRTLDRTTFQFSDYWSLKNYQRALSESFTVIIIWRSLFGALVVTFVTLILAFPSWALLSTIPSKGFHQGVQALARERIQKDNFKRAPRGGPRGVQRILY